MPKGQSSPVKTKVPKGGARWCDKPDADWRMAEPLDLRQQLDLALVQLRDTQRRLDEASSNLHRKDAEEVRLRRLLRREGSRNKQLTERIDSLEQLHCQLPAIIGHEFRTPISIIQGWSEHLLDVPGRDPLDAEHLDEILRASQELSRKVDRSIMLAQALAGQLVLDPQPLELKEALERAVCVYAEQISALGLAVDQRVPASAPRVWFDGVCLDAVLLALVENAVKFNRPNGSIRLSSQRHRGGILLAIRNTGAGIPSDRLNHVFRPFDQVELGSTRRFGGLGLGLALVKQLLEHAGASITVASAGSERGAIFTIWLPCANTGS